MLGPQRQRCLLPESLDTLAQHGLQAPAVSRVFMPGYLFYSRIREHGMATPISCPAHHLRGQWLSLDKLCDIDTHAWVPLIKPHWLGPWIQSSTPDNYLLTQALSEIEHTLTPRLFAELQQDHINGVWKEVDRIFIVPTGWPCN